MPTITATPDTRPASTSRDPAPRFLVEMARALASHGLASHELETAMTSCARALGYEASFYATPTSVMVSLSRDDEDERTHAIRVDSVTLDLDRLSAIDEIRALTTAGAIPPREGLRRLRALLDIRHEPTLAASVAVSAALSAAAAIFFEASLLGVALAAALAILVALHCRFASGQSELSRLSDFVAGFACAFLASIASIVLPIAPQTVTIAALIALVPGLTFTVALSELAARSLVSGTARLLGAMTTLVLLTLGVALGLHAANAVGFATTTAAPPLPAWTVHVAAVLAALCLGVVFRAHRTHLLIVTLTGLLGFYAARAARDPLGPELASGAAAVAVGLAANAFSRLTGRPPIIALLPGIFLLVPGSVGLRSFGAFLEGDPYDGLTGAFRMLMIGAALVTGMLLANVLIHPRASLRAARTKREAAPPPAADPGPAWWT